MTFTFHHPSHYKKIKQNSGRLSEKTFIGPSKDNVSEVHSYSSNYGDNKVGKVSRLSLNLSSSTRTQPKENK